MAIDMTRPVDRMRADGAACPTGDTASMTSLVNGIITDAQNLIREEVALAKQEIKDEVTKLRTVAVAAGAGIGVAVLALVLLSFFLVHLLHWASGGTDPAAVPLWAWFLIVGVVFLGAAGALFALAYNRLKDVHLVPRQTVQTMKENVQWIKNQT